jgi:hypothetical protein
VYDFATAVWGPGYGFGTSACRCHSRYSDKHRDKSDLASEDQIAAGQIGIGYRENRPQITGLYRGLGASCLGVTESTLHWVLYEQLKILLKKSPDTRQTSWDRAIDVGGRIAAAGSSKLIAVLVTYPH